MANNVQKFSKQMGVLIKGMEHLTFLFFSEIEKRKVSKKKSRMANSKRKKQNGGKSRELKRLETSINYENISKGGKSVGGVRLIC